MSTLNESQTSKIFNFLVKGKTISAPQAFSLFKVKNLRARINDLRKEGFNIQASKNTKGNTAYSLVSSYAKSS